MACCTFGGISFVSFEDRHTGQKAQGLQRRNSDRCGSGAAGRLISAAKGVDAPVQLPAAGAVFSGGRRPAASGLLPADLLQPVLLQHNHLLRLCAVFGLSCADLCPGVCAHPGAAGREHSAEPARLASQLRKNLYADHFPVSSAVLPCAGDFQSLADPARGLSSGESAGRRAGGLSGGRSGAHLSPGLRGFRL